MLGTYIRRSFRDWRRDFSFWCIGVQWASPRLGLAVNLLQGILGEAEVLWEGTSGDVIASVTPPEGPVKTQENSKKWTTTKRTSEDFAFQRSIFTYLSPSRVQTHGLPWGCGEARVTWPWRPPTRQTKKPVHVPSSMQLAFPFFWRLFDSCHRNRCSKSGLHPEMMEVRLNEALFGTNGPNLKPSWEFKCNLRNWKKLLSLCPNPLRVSVLTRVSSFNPPWYPRPLDAILNYQNLISPSWPLPE